MMKETLPKLKQPMARSLVSSSQRIFKLTIMLLTVFYLQVSANGYSQKLTLHENNASLKSIFEKVKTQTGYQFFYSDDVMRSAKKVTIDLTNADLTEALNACMAGQGISYTISDKTIILKRAATPTVTTANTYAEISGKVTDEDGSPLSGATVQVKGTANGTATDASGNFKINANPGDILVISYVGYLPTEVKVGTTTSIAVTLVSAAKTGEEVIVVGYGTQKRSNVTGAVSTVNLEKATAIPTTNVAEMIRGQAAGVQVTLGSARPGGTSNILIRGRNSITATNDPLIVLDGFPIPSINDVNPDDIASIEVLKDAASQAIYGARASNGVILITTKRGKSGKFRVTSNNYVTTQKLTKNFELYNGDEFAQLRREAIRTTNPVINGVQAYSPDSINFGGSTNSPEYKNFIRGNFFNWEDEVLQTGVINSHTLTVSGGSENTRSFTSANFFNQKGLIPTSGYQRGTFRTNLTQIINKKISIEGNLNILVDKQKRESSSLDFITISPFTGPYNENGVLVRDLAGANASSSSINPLWNIRESDNDIKVNLFNLNLVGNYKLNKNFSYKLNTLLSRRITDQGEYLSRLHSAGSGDVGRATVSNTLREEYLIENILNYVGQINNNHRFEATVLQSVNQRTTSFTQTIGTGFPNDVLSYDGITNALNSRTTRDEQRYRLASIMGRLRYTLLDKYLLEVTSRYDGASVFAENNKSSYFPAASIGWQMHKESFLKNVRQINEMKLRVGYGSVGNQSLNPYTTLGVVNPFPYIFNGNLTSGYLPGTQLNNLNLTWETSTTFNAGLDFKLFQRRVSGSIDYFKTNTTDLLVDKSLAGGSGYNSTITNGGESENHGLEVLLSGDVVRKGDFKWNVTGIYSQYRNKIVKTGIVGVNGEQKDDLGRNRFVGQPINNIRTYIFDGIFQTDKEALESGQGSLGGTVNPFQNLTTLVAGSIKLKDVNGDGVINDADNVVVASDPKWFGSLSSNFTYKNFDLLADLYIAEGAMKSNPYLSSFNQGGTLQSVRNGIKVDYWTPENPSNTFPRPSFTPAPANISALALRDASYWRLRTLSLGYNFGRSLLSTLHMTSVRAYATATNLFTVTNYKSYSPENNPGEFPDTKSFTFGLNIGL